MTKNIPHCEQFEMNEGEYDYDIDVHASLVDILAGNGSE